MCVHVPVCMRVCVCVHVCTRNAWGLVESLEPVCSQVYGKHRQAVQPMRAVQVERMI